MHKVKEFLDLYRKGLTEELRDAAQVTTKTYHGKGVLLRALIEYSNYCRLGCLYCGIRTQNSHIKRYRMSLNEILEVAKKGYQRGLRTVVLQGGEDPWFTPEKLCRLVEGIKKFSEEQMAVTLSCGILERAAYQELRDAGVDRYLLRFETSDKDLYVHLKEGDALSRRLTALEDLKEIGYEVGSGYLVGLPGENEETRINNALLAHSLQLDMVGIGPFIPHPRTPLGGATQTPIELTIDATALLRLLLPQAHIPATTAAGSLDPEGREKMLQAGANVLMPNITPPKYKKHYLLYPGKVCLEESGFECLGCLRGRVEGIGRYLDFGKGSALRLVLRAV